MDVPGRLASACGAPSLAEELPVHLECQRNLTQEGERYVMAGDETLLWARGTERRVYGEGLVEPGRDNVAHTTWVHEGPCSVTLDLQAGPQEVAI